MNLIETTPPDSPVEGGGDDEMWTVSCAFGRLFERSLIEQIMELPTPMAVIHLHETDSHTLAFGALGHMDEAVAGAVISIRGIVGIVEDIPREVRLTSHRDWERILDSREAGRTRSFDVTGTVLSQL